MLDINYIRENPDKVKEAAKNKNRVVDIDKILDLENKRVEHIQKSQKLREERNAFPKSKPDAKTLERGKQIKEELKIVEDELTKIESELKNLMLYVPSVPLDEVPVGKDPSGNKELKKWGEIPKFNFKIKDHIQLGTELDIFDLEGG